MNQKTSNPKLPSHFINTDLCIILKSVWCSTVSTVTWIQDGKSGVQILAAARERTISSPKHPDKLQCPISLQLNENQSYFSGSKVARADSLTTQTLLEASIKISAAIPPLNLSANTAHTGTTLLHLYPYLCTYLS